MFVSILTANHNLPTTHKRQNWDFIIYPVIDWPRWSTQLSQFIASFFSDITILRPNSLKTIKKIDVTLFSPTAIVPRRMWTNWPLSPSKMVSCNCYFTISSLKKREKFNNYMGCYALYLTDGHVTVSALTCYQPNALLEIPTISVLLSMKNCL